MDVTATVAGSAIRFVFWEFGKAVFGLTAGYFIADAFINNTPASPSISIPENTKPKTDAKEKDITIPSRPKKQAFFTVDLHQFNPHGLVRKKYVAPGIGKMEVL